MHKTYSGKIIKLKPNEIFCFGSNPTGRHGFGAALFAVKFCGAKYGQGKGMQGQSYAIVTKDLTKYKHPSISVDYIIEQIDELYKFAELSPELDFLIAYSGTGVNLCGYTPVEMSKMFTRPIIPSNIVFEEKFYELIKENYAADFI